MQKKESIQRNMIWNAAGNLAYLFAQWLLMVLVTWLWGLSEAGVLSIAMSVSATLQTLALFGIRHFQVSDIENKYSDSTYVSLRLFTSLLAFILCPVTVLCMGYVGGEVFWASICIMLFRIAECFSDVLHGISQKNGRLDLAGKGFAIKSVATLGGFFFGYFVFAQDHILSLLSTAVFSWCTTLLFDLICARKLSAFRISFRGGAPFLLAKNTAALCVYLFLYSALSTIPKYLLDITMTDTDPNMLGAYSSIFAPALLIQAAATYLYNPFAPRFAELYAKGRKKDFLLLIAKIVGALVLLLAAMMVCGYFFGDFGLQLLFGDKILGYTHFLLPILVAVFATALLGFFCMLAVVLRIFPTLIAACSVSTVLSIAVTYLLLIWLKDGNGASYGMICAAFTASLILWIGVLIRLHKGKKPMPNTDMREKHTFVICAYKESAFLEECILSLRAQTVRSEIILATATPNAHIEGLAEKYGIPLYINTGEKGISADWNFGVSNVKTPYLTIAHQDDVYDPTYAESVITAMEKKKTLIAYTGYFEIRAGERVYKNRILSVKKKMNLPIRLFPRSRFVRRRVLSLGNAICCPAVTYRTDLFESFAFDKELRFVCDWDAWERLSRKKGAFRYISAPLMGHRIHEESATTLLTATSRRAEEETMLFRRFHGKAVTKLLMRSYAKGADSNDLSK